MCRRFVQTVGGHTCCFSPGTMVRAWVAVVFAGLALVGGHLGCAEPDFGTDPLPVGDDPRRSGAEAPKPDPPKTTEPVWNDDAGGPPSDGGGGGPEGGAAKISCEPTNTCATARTSTIASIPGDDTLVPLEMRGSTSEFVQLRITESSSLWYDLKVKATLTSPPGTNFDLLVYVPATDTATDCNVFAGVSTATSGEDVVRATWSDSLIGDDSKTVVFEIRNTSGECSSARDARWLLKLQGYAD